MNVTIIGFGTVEIESVPVKHELAKLLLKLKAIKIQIKNPFTWTSGWRSPFYCDLRKTLSNPEVREFIKKALCITTFENFFPDVEAIAGVATGGIPQGTLVADFMELPFVYVRSHAKDHGLENIIEGELTPGMKVVVVEDLISTGSSSLKAIEAIRAKGCEVIGVVTPFTYSFPVAEEAFRNAGVKVVTLTDYEHLIAEAIKMGYISKSDKDVLDKWRQDPENWGK